MKKILLEAHDDLVEILVRCRIKIEDREDPTVLDILTDLRSMQGIVTVRQTRPVSDVISAAGHRIIELTVSYIPKIVDDKDVFMKVLNTIKSVEGVSMVKALEHNKDPSIDAKLKRRPIVI